MKVGNFVEGECESFILKQNEKPQKVKTKLKFNQLKKLSEGILIEEGVVYFVQFKDEKEIKNSRKIKYGGARIMLVGVQAVGKVKLYYLFFFLKNYNFIFYFYF
jgi:hypothetical protein